MAEEFDLGKKLKGYRTKRGMTQAQLANLIGKSPSTVYGYESNQIKPNYDTICLICAILAVDIRDLLDLNQKKSNRYKDMGCIESTLRTVEEKNMNKPDIYDVTGSLYAATKGTRLGKLIHPGVYKKTVEYVKLEYNGTICSDLVKTGSGWACVVKTGERRIVLYITKKDGEELSFWEKEI